MHGISLRTSRYFKPSTFLSLALFICSAAQGRALTPGETASVNPGDTAESWDLADGSTLNVEAGGQVLNVGGSGAGTLNMNTGSSAQQISITGSQANLNGASVLSTSTAPAFQANGSNATLTDTTITSTNGIGIFGTQTGAGGGSAFAINGGAISGAVGGVSLSVDGTLNAVGTTITGTGVDSYGVRAINSTMSFSNSTVTGGTNGLLYQGSTGATGTVEFDNSHVEGTTGAAILISSTRANTNVTLNLRNGTTLTGGNGNALEVTGSIVAGVLVQNSAIVGNVDVTNGGTANLSFDHGQLTGDITVDGSSQGTLALNNGSVLQGDVTGIDTVSLNGSSMTGDITSASSAGTVALSAGSSLQGNISSDNVSLNASAMTGDITSLTSSGTVALSAGSSLQGNISSDNVSLSASAMTGDITSSSGNGTVSLQNDAVFTGNLIGVDQLTIGDPSVWNMVASNAINTLVMDTGVVKFGAANEFYQLDVGTLSGTGTFIMDADYQTNQHDTLNVTGTATGSHTLQVAGSGVDPVSPEALTLVHTGGGDATFALVGGAVDVGTYSYALSSVANGSGGTDWFLDPSKATISPGTASVLALFNTAPTVWYGELTSLRSRMGELRFNGGQAGGWMRAYGNKYIVNGAAGLGYQQNQQGVSLGADAPLPFGDGQWLIGALAGYSDSDLNLSRGSSGTVKSYYVGAYTTWLDQDSGYYFDGVLKLNRLRNDSKVSMSDGTRAKGDYNNFGMGGSVEFGRHIKLDNGYFVEPFTQWSAVVFQGKDYGLDNGMEAEGDRARSLLGKIGMTAGRNFALQDGKVLQPYVRLAGVHEFVKTNDVQVNDNVFNNDLSGSRGELGAGIAVAFTEAFQMHADFDYANGKHIEQPFGANVGLRYSW